MSLIIATALAIVGAYWPVLLLFLLVVAVCRPSWVCLGWLAAKIDFRRTRREWAIIFGRIQQKEESDKQD